MMAVLAELRISLGGHFHFLYLALSFVEHE